MSAQATFYVSHMRNIPGSKKLVLLALADYYNNEKDAAWPSHSTLAEWCGITDRTVRTQLKALQEDGFIVREPRYKEDGSRNTDYIRLVGFKAFNKKCAERAAASVAEITGEIIDEQDVKSFHQEDEEVRNQIPEGAETVSDNPITDPINNNISQFEEFWSAYPHPKNRGGKESTKKLYSSSLRKISHDELCRAARAYGAFLAKPDEKWRQAKQAIGWLRHELWDEWLEASSPKPAEIVPPVDWSATVGYFVQKGEDPRSWSEGWGPAPNQPGCLCPPEILKAHGYHNTTEGRV